MIYFSIRNHQGKLSYHSILQNTTLQKLLSQRLQPQSCLSEQETLVVLRSTKVLIVDSNFAFSRNGLATEVWNHQSPVIDTIALGGYRELITELNSYTYTVCQSVEMDNLTLSILAATNGSIPLIHHSDAKLLNLWQPGVDCLVYEDLADVTKIVNDPVVTLAALVRNAASKASVLARGAGKHRPLL